MGDEQFSSDDPRDPTTDDVNDPWVSDDDVNALSEERDVMGYDETEQAERIFKENLPAVAQAVVKLSRSAQSETVRLNAAKYVIDRNLGKITEPVSTEESPTEEFLKGVVVSS